MHMSKIIFLGVGILCASAMETCERKEGEPERGHAEFLTAAIPSRSPAPPSGTPIPSAPPLDAAMEIPGQQGRTNDQRPSAAEPLRYLGNDVVLAIQNEPENLSWQKRVENGLKKFIDNHKNKEKLSCCKNAVLKCLTTDKNITCLCLDGKKGWWCSRQTHDTCELLDKFPRLKFVTLLSLMGIGIEVYKDVQDVVKDKLFSEMFTAEDDLVTALRHELLHCEEQSANGDTITVNNYHVTTGSLVNPTAEMGDTQIFDPNPIEDRAQVNFGIKDAINTEQPHPEWTSVTTDSPTAAPTRAQTPSPTEILAELVGIASDQSSLDALEEKVEEAKDATEHNKSATGWVRYVMYGGGGALAALLIVIAVIAMANSGSGCDCTL